MRAVSKHWWRRLPFKLWWLLCLQLVWLWLDVLQAPELTPIASYTTWLWRLPLWPWLLWLWQLWLWQLRLRAAMR